jgi:endo-1,3(4)-beta-glucanase
MGTWTHPYSVSWSKGGGAAQSWGLSISHVDANQRVFGPQSAAISGSPNTYFVNPLGIQSIILSAAELGPSTVLTTDTLQAFSVNVNLQPQPESAGRITFPLVQGMGFVTALYSGLQPALHSGVFFRTVVAAGSPKNGVFKYRITLEDGKAWLVYAIPSNGADPNLQLASNTLLRGPAGFSGIIQVAKNPGGAPGEQIYDGSAGAYATTAHVSGSVSGAAGSYSLSWNKAGVQAGNSSLVMYALPHHVQSFDVNTKSHISTVQLNTTTKGVATAVVADSWTMVESSLPVDMDFAPWRPDTGSTSTLSAMAKAIIANVSASEVSQNMYAQTNLDSFYFAGKALSKFATIVYTIYDLQQNPSLAAAGLANLKDAFATWVNQEQVYPLVYDTAWKGVVSSGTYKTGNSGLDFGNTYYNDHRESMDVNIEFCIGSGRLKINIDFHFAYFIHTAAIIGYLDPSWLTANQAWVNTLVRDASNPSSQDPMFPFSRSFDWYHGHSWAKGLFESGDGKDEESSSEDAMFAYALKMWGRTIGDKSMEARGNLMLSILTRTLQSYFLLESSNTNQPASFIGNKVTGIVSIQPSFAIALTRAKRGAQVLLVSDFAMSCQHLHLYLVNQTV